MYVLLKNPIFMFYDLTLFVHMLSNNTIFLHFCCLTIQYFYIYVVLQFLDEFGIFIVIRSRFFFPLLKRKYFGILMINLHVLIKLLILTNSPHSLLHHIIH